jgi:hypothetical protein
MILYSFQLNIEESEHCDYTNGRHIVEHASTEDICIVCIEGAPRLQEVGLDTWQHCHHCRTDCY